MNINQKIISAVSPFVQDVFPNRDLAIGKEVYCTFNYQTQTGQTFADDFPQDEVAYLELHLFAPANFNYKQKVKDIRKALYMADFTFPIITELFENDTKYNHIVFEFEYSISVDY